MSAGSPFEAVSSHVVAANHAVRRRALARLRRSFRVLGLFFALALIWVGFAVGSPYFFTADNILNILLQASNVALVAAGLTVVMITAEIDLAIGSIEAFTGAIAAIVIIKAGLPVAVGIPAALLSGIVAGMVSGVLTAKFKLVSFVSTLAMLGIAQGAAYLLTNGQSVYGFPSAYRAIGTSTVGSIPTPTIIAVAGFLALHFMLTRTRLGQKMFAVGGNAEVAANAGINVSRIKLVGLVISGFTAGLGGIIVSARLNAGNGLFGAGDLLNAVAAVVIGGTSLTGGVGTMAGTALGVLIIATVANGMVLLNVPSFWQQIVVGWIIILAVLVDQMTKNARLPRFLR